MGPVVGQHGVVDGALRQFGVQFAGVAVGIAAVEIVDAVGDVRGLLDFGDERPCADRMHASRGQEEYVARCDLVVGQNVRDRIVSDAGLVLGRGHLSREARTQVCVLIRRHHVPHFGLALGFVAFPGQFIVRVHLDREVLPGVDELDQQRKLLAEAFVVGFAEQCGAVAGDQLRERRSGLGTFGDDGFVVLDARKFPAFADVALVGGDPFIGGDLLAAPDQGFQNRLKFIHGRYTFMRSLRRAGSKRKRMRRPKWPGSRRVSKP